MHLHAHTQTKHKDTEDHLSDSCQIPSTSDCHPPLSAHHSSLTTPCAEPLMPHYKPHIRTLADKLDNDHFRTPNSPGGSDPDPREPDNPDNDDGDNDDNASGPSIKENPILMLTKAIIHLSCTTRHRPEDLALPQAFCLDSQKVSFALSFLKGINLAWFKPDLLNAIPGPEPAWADDYSKFITELTTNFSPHDPVGNAKHQLNNLSMKDAAALINMLLSSIT
ncbi:hypothetical protein ID866_11247 [Astraeus odoratus]|nr:hypothetical protein ID866_11247 [Astraeus odoratus]